MQAYWYTIVVTLACLGSSVSCRAAIISGKPEPSTETLYFSPRAIDIDGDGVVDIDITARTLITNDEPSSTSATTITVRTHGSNLILIDQHHPRRFEQVDRKNFAAATGTAHWENGHSAIGYYHQPQADLQVWDGGLRGFMLVLLAKANDYHPGWVQLDIRDQWNGEVGPSPFPKIIDWHYDTDPIHVDPDRIQPRIQQIDPPSPFEQVLHVDRLIEGHRYTIEWSPVLTANTWQAVEEFQASGTNRTIWWNVARAEGTRFFRLRHAPHYP